MGIDIGAMTSIAQIGPPPSVASLRQRAGRSGRRDEPAVLRIYAAEDPITAKDSPADKLRPGLIQEIAALQLLTERWCEPPDPNVPHYSTLIQQIMSVIVERGGIQLAPLYQLLCRRGPFRDVTKDDFVQVLRNMKAKELLEQMDDGTLLLAKKGERITSHFSFYAAFATKEEFRIVQGSRTLGTMPIESALRVNDHIIFGGRRWRILDVNEEDRVILVAPSSGGKVPIFGGDGGHVHDKVRSTMRHLLRSNTPAPPFLNAVASELLTEARANYAAMNLDDQSFVEHGADTYAFHWSGDRTALTLALLLSSHDMEVTTEGISVVVRASMANVKECLQLIVHSERPTLTELVERVKTKRANKYDWVLSDLLLNQEFAARELDLDAAYQKAAELLGSTVSITKPAVSPSSPQVSRSTATRLQVLAGEESIGGTKILLSSGGEDVLIDFGLDFKQYGHYFEEFLRPRSARGLVDLWHFGLVPRLGNAYRKDIQPLGESFDSAHTVNLRGILLSHAHVDHFGMIGTLPADVPIHASPLSLAIMKASQDSGRLDFWGEAVYIKERAPAPKDQRALTSQGGRTLGRDCHVIGTLNDDLSNFLTSLPSGRGEDAFVSCIVRSSSGKLGPFTYDSWSVDHSLPGCMGFRIHTEIGDIAYSGDLRFHGGNKAATYAFMEALAKNPPELLICEGTQVGRDEPNTTSEAEVRDTAAKIVAGASGKLVIADFGPRHVERLRCFYEIAIESNRRLVVTAKDAYLLQALFKADPKINMINSPQLMIYDEVRGVPQKWEQDIRSQFDHRMIDAREIHQNQGWYILAFSFFDCNELVDVMPDNAVYIYSSSEAYSEDQTQDIRRLWHWCQSFNIEVHGFEFSNDRLSFPHRLNASGHAVPDDLAKFIQAVNPRFLMPVHRSASCIDWFRQVVEPLSTRIVMSTFPCVD